MCTSPRPEVKRDSPTGVDPIDPNLAHPGFERAEPVDQSRPLTSRSPIPLLATSAGSVPLTKIVTSPIAAGSPLSVVVLSRPSS